MLKAGQTPGSPQLNSFGPNMLLAKELLEKGERKAVLDYLELCGNFWENNPKWPLRQQWIEAIKAGKIPEFKANLIY